MIRECTYATTLAHKLLDNPSLDPDGDASVLARQFLRERERAEALRQAGSLDHPLRAVPAVTVTELRLIAKQLGLIDRDLVEAAADEIERLRTFITQNQPPAPTPCEAN